MMQIIHADIVYSKDREHLAVHPDSYIAVDKGIVKGIWPVIPDEYIGALSAAVKAEAVL